jgi:cob(I)alamin adenosyltransferase
MRITKVYTRTGDKGTTRLVGGSEVHKDDARIEAYGTVDELNAVLGIVRTLLGDDDPLDDRLGTVQDDLFNVGTDLATPEGSRWEGMYRVGDADVEQLERWIDAMNADLEPLAEFILPGGGPAGAQLHLARTVCRRAERRVVTLGHLDPELSDGALRYLNRLSDFLFVASRWAAKRHGVPETTWRNPSKRSRSTSG